MNMRKCLARPFQFSAYLLLAACAAIPGGDRATFDNPWGHKPEPASASAAAARPVRAPQPLANQGAAPAAVTSPGPRAEIYPGAGSMIELGSAGVQPLAQEGDITLNFQQMEIAEVVKIILGEILGLN